MIFPHAIGATGTITTLALATAQGDVVNALAQHMAKAIVHEAEQRAIPIDIEDIVVYRVGADENAQTVEYGAVWAPSPMTRGIEFFGGSHDGEIMMRIAPDDGPGQAFPPRSIRVMSEPPTSFDFEPLPPEIRSHVLVEDYERAGIDPLKRRFIYKIKVTN